MSSVFDDADAEQVLVGKSLYLFTYKNPFR